MTSSEILVQIKNNTDKVMATNVFNVDEYDWDVDARPNTNLHERVVGPQSEIAELSQMNSTKTTSYNLGLTCSDGCYLELTVNHGKMVTEGGPPSTCPATAEEVCQVSGSLGTYRVETALTGTEPLTLQVSIFDKDEE